VSPDPNNIPARTVGPTSPNDNLVITPEPMKPETDEFKLLLIEYARSIINSTIDHCPDESEALKNNIITAKKKVVVKYRIVETELSIAGHEIRKLKASNLQLRKAQAASKNDKKVDITRIQDLEKQLRGRPEVKGKERVPTCWRKQSRNVRLWRWNWQISRRIRRGRGNRERQSGRTRKR